MSTVLIVAGVLALGDVAVTLVWQEPFSALYAHFQQTRLGDELQGVERSTLAPLERRALGSLRAERRRIAFLARQLRAKTAEGGPLGRIEIPHIGVDFVVVQGTGVGALEEGPGVYSRESFPGASFPGLAGTTAIAGHRTTYLAPFRHIDSLGAGDRIVLTMPYGRFIYKVSSTHVVAPTDVQAAVGNVGHPRLVLSACTPLFSAAERILVFARLSRTVPLGAARLPTHLPPVLETFKPHLGAGRVQQ